MWTELFCIEGVVNVIVTNTIQCSLFQVLSIEIVLCSYVAQDGSGLHQLHSINFNHRDFLEEQESIWKQRNITSSLSCSTTCHYKKKEHISRASWTHLFPQNWMHRTASKVFEDWSLLGGK